MLQQLLFSLPPEKAHRLAIQTLKCMQYLPSPSCGQDGTKDYVSLFGLNFRNRLGIAAGFDKDGEAYQGLWKLGFGSVEVGTVTPLPQAGNPKPRLFRLEKDKAVINRMGFNSLGLESMALRLAKQKQSSGTLGINIGPNKTSDNPVEDYEKCLIRLAPFADYFTINLSSPNTPGLRDLQHGEKLKQLLKKIVETRQYIEQEYELSPPLLIKVSPDWQNEKDFYNLLDQGIVHQVDGFIISNTTVNRAEYLQSQSAHEGGGLSGVPLFIPSTVILAKAFQHLKGEVPLIGVGGIHDENTAVLKMKAGASLLQIYSNFVYTAHKMMPSMFVKRNSGMFCDIRTSFLNSTVIGSASREFCKDVNIEIAMQSHYENNSFSF